ncbi:MAG: hypothetical protein FWB72_01275 [Firmicutes bacterium]|nr:hypothetical protein [Bacillota bacterium]
MTDKSRKQIAFDLKQEWLKEYYPKPAITLNPDHYKNAYYDLKRFFIKERWAHRQGSVYTSNYKLDDSEVSDIIDKLAKAMPWLTKCVRAIDVTDVSSQHCLKHRLALATKNALKSKTKVTPALKHQKYNSTNRNYNSYDDQM